MKKKIFITIFLLATLLWIGFIWGNSMENSEESGEKSSKAVEIIEDLTEAVGIEAEISEFSVRKLAHFTEFFILGALLCFDFFFVFLYKKDKPRGKAALLLALAPAAALAVAITDEMIQSSSPGRVPSPVDVTIDLSGATLAYLFAILILLVILPYIKNKRASKADIKNKENP